MKQASSSFFEKKEPKKLLPVCTRLPATRAQTDKSFLLLFFKKEDACFLNPK
jgi:hypothetical protein